ncbi:hypothetical protein I7X12_06895 [Halosimplex litoreum]|uniref:Uncharacterized protein n=1 Tax=Halosimplex litoreum TaxID=1198301 RepID=A0A7T3KWW3_9EURY|nr:hypothetical protein [Halosimplex litoreum]QPV64335.1 hypothetical protein I7X12_06895 [Halosimplex litoreum]
MTNTEPTMENDESRTTESITEHLYEALRTQDEAEKHRHIRESLQLVESLEERK